MSELDHASEEGAQALADQIRRYWAERGHTVVTHVYQVSRGSRRAPATWGVKTDMVGGLPRPPRD